MRHVAGRDLVPRSSLKSQGSAFTLWPISHFFPPSTFPSNGSSGSGSEEEVVLTGPIEEQARGKQENKET